MKKNLLSRTPFKRFNARITVDQYEFIKAKAKKDESSESNAHREMLEAFINKFKTK